MNVKAEVRRVAMMLFLMCFMNYATSLFVFAGSLDDLSSGQTSGSYEAGSNNSNDGAISDYLRGYTPVTGDNMKSASTVASPIVNFLGTMAGGIIMIASAAIFVVTALDLCYIGLPFCRGWLNPELAGGGAQAGGGMPMGGMGGMGGFGRGGMMGGGMMGAGGGQAGGVVESGLRRKWVSDEAVFCVNTYASHGQAGGAQTGGMSGGMGMGGMGMMGGGMMGGGMGGQQQQPDMPTKSVIFEYLKKRVFFIIVFSVCAVLLMSSVLMDCGINLAELAIKVINNINGSIAGVNV